MYSFDPEVEEKALKAYREDPLTHEEISDIFGWDQAPSDSYEGGQIEMSVNRSVDASSDVQYLGGKADLGGNKSDGEGGSLLSKILCCCGSKSKSDSQNDFTQHKWSSMNEAQRKERISQLWAKARRYNNKLRFQARLQKMAESNLKEMMIDDINEDADEENQILDQQPKLKWYLIDTERTFCKVWNFFITLLTIYNLFVTPFIIVFPDVYQDCDDNWENCTNDKNYQKNLRIIEYIIDFIYLIEIIFNFLKKTRAHKDLSMIASNYLTGYFIFDVIATVPELIFFQEGLRFYKLKAFRIIHVYRLTQPLQLLLQCALQKYSKKRQNDLTGFAGLIFLVIYTSHMMACAWLYLGMQESCSEPGVEWDSDQAEEYYKSTPQENCTRSWVYENDFFGRPYHTQYIFAFYWIFEVITTVGYGDYSGATSNEYIFSIALEFMGLTFFSFLMGSINGIFNTSDNFDDLIEEKLDSLDMWIKKIEKSNKPFHIQPTLYNDIRKYVEQAFLYDFNLVIEEFQFYQQITPKMQTDLIQNTRVFKEFERSFNHFFEECERGFTNEIIINMYCRIYTPGKTVIAYKSNVKEMYFIRQGLVEVYNNENDEIHKEKPILYLPKNSYFGDYQILYNLKSNIVFKTLAHSPDPGQKPTTNEPMPDIIFMCISKDALLELCDLFPQTAENIKRRSLERRYRFMQQKNTNSRRYNNKKQEKDSVRAHSANSTEQSHNKMDGAGDDQLEDFFSDEEPENFESQKEDMKMYLNKLNKRIDTLVEALKEADQQMAKMGDQKAIIEQINQKKNFKNQGRSGGSSGSDKKLSIADMFKSRINPKRDGK